MIAIEKLEIQNYVDGLTDFQKEIVLTFREVILSSSKIIKEDIKWGSIAFHNHKNICGFRVAKAHITLLFMEGASLDDKNSILSGTGPKARTIKVTNSKEIPKTAIKDLMKQALKLGM